MKAKWVYRQEEYRLDDGICGYHTRGIDTHTNSALEIDTILLVTIGIDSIEIYMNHRVTGNRLMRYLTSMHKVAYGCFNLVS